MKHVPSTFNSRFGATCTALVFALYHSKYANGLKTGRLSLRYPPPSLRPRLSYLAHENAHPPRNCMWP